MGRLVEPMRLERVAIRGSGGLESAATAIVPVGGDNYQDRIAKYIPGEVIAAYMSLDRMVVPSVDTFVQDANAFAAAGAQKAGPAASFLADAGTRLAVYQSLPIIIFLIGVLFTPLYIRQIAHRSGTDTRWRTQAVMSTLAFVVWAYAIQGGVFTAGLGIYHGTFASALLIFFTLASGLFEPEPINRPGAG